MEIEVEIRFLGCTAKFTVTVAPTQRRSTPPEPEGEAMVIFAEDDLPGAAAALAAPEGEVPVDWQQRYSIEEATGQIAFKLKNGQDEADVLEVLTRYR